MKRYFPKSKTGKFVSSFLLLFILFNFTKFIWIRIISLGQPKGKIVFNSDRDGDHDIYTMNFNGTHIRKLTRNSRTKTSIAADIGPSFSPDGKKIVFISGKDHPDIFTTKYPDGTEVIEHRGGPDFLPEASFPKGKTMIFEQLESSNYEIYVMDLDGRNQERLTHNDFKDTNPIFSPDGKNIAYIIRPEFGPALLSIMNSDGSNKKILTQCSEKEFKFSPDGKKIVFNYQGKLYVINSDGSGLAELISQKPFFLGDFTLSPNSKEIAFVVSEGRYEPYKFYTINTDGTGLKEIFIPSENLGFGDMEFTPDGRKVIFLSGGYIYILDVTTNSMQKIINLPENFFARLFSLSPCGEKIIFTVRIRYDKETKILSSLFSIFRNPIGFRVALLFQKPLAWIHGKLDFPQNIYMVDIDGQNQKRIGTASSDISFYDADFYWKSN